MQNTLDGINSSLDVAEEKISELEDKAVRTIRTKTRRGKVLLSKQCKKNEHD